LHNIKHLPELVANILSPTTTALESVNIAVLTIFVLVMWKQFAKGKLASIPGALMAVVAATVTTYFMHLPLKTIPLPESIFSGIQFLDFGAVSKMDPWSIARFSMVLAIIASAETLLSAAAVDKLHRGPRTKYDKELIAQGIGNTICGLIGALPMTGVIARSSVNVMSGARTNRSAILHGIWLLMAVVAFPDLLRMVPVASLAALLFFTGFKLIDFNGICKLWNFGPRLVGVYVLTTIAIVSTDLLVGVAVGVALSVIKLVYTMTRLNITIDRIENKSVLHLRGAATFLSLPRLADALDSVPANTELHVCMDELDYVDHACLELIMDWEKQHESTGGSLVMDWGELRAMFKSKRRSRHMRTAPPAGSLPVHGHSQNNREPAAV
ncbi:MAG TPA: SulP family inorganic anion transporter, partial [Candidatus Melainabacteria bacterium]|nr:SulP family inorganic anion transporter [Candidatus Melainabacteria bacterium]